MAKIGETRWHLPSGQEGRRGLEQVVNELLKYARGSMEQNGRSGRPWRTAW
jgi:hypothetical protein